jgi:methyl-accepting chemotaxis protein
MNINTPLRADESKESLEVEGRRIFRELARAQAASGDVKTSADDLAALLHRLSDVPSQEIEKLIDALQALRQQLQNAGNRIQRDIAEYAELSGQIMQLTTIISDSVKKLPRGTHR